MSCKKCGSTKNIHSHHINVWRPGIRRDRSYGNETIPLCATCHAWVHSYNNRQDEYLQVTKSKPAEIPDIEGAPMPDRMSPFYLTSSEREAVRNLCSGMSP